MNTLLPEQQSPRITACTIPERPLLLRSRGWRLFLFYSAALLLTGLVSLLFADLLWRTGWSTAGTILLVLFVILFLLAAIGFMHALFGFALRRCGDANRITTLKDVSQVSIAEVSTAIVFPIYNEGVARVCEGLRTTFLSLKQTGQLDHFDFFILSDSTDPDKWVQEEKQWFELVRELNALGRIYYRHRLANEGKKSGNIRDFLNSWGRHYRYFIVFDADSVMQGAAVVELVKLMEAHPQVGLIQTVPALINAESLFGRMQQFANRLYAPIFISGLNFWTQSFGNYWGHNAIIRTEPFMQYCDLPQLPGSRPFGGHILSHDFVEAALMLKENWQVWLAHDLPGSYEEAPQSMIENAQRDRRWCQGNLQHSLLLLAKGLRGVSRLHLLLGIFGYLASPLWLLFLLTFNWTLWTREQSGLTEITVRSRTPFITLNGPQHAFLIFTICMAVLFFPKILALADLALNNERRRSFGGLTRASLGALAETLFSALHAPLQMLWHSRFVVSVLLGGGVSWSAQKRTADGVAWTDALREHWGHTLTGLCWGGLVWWIDPRTFWWFAPVMAGMVVSVPLTVFTSRSKWGRYARASGLFVTPEESAPPPEIQLLRSRMEALENAGETAPQPRFSGVADALLDPYINAIHVSLLREQALNPDYQKAMERLGAGTPGGRALGEKWLLSGPDDLSAAERMQVLCDAETVSWIHRQAWLRPGQKLGSWWQTAIRRYAR